MSEPGPDQKKRWRARNTWLIGPALLLAIVGPRACDLYDSTLDRAPLLTIHNRSDVPISFRIESTPAPPGGDPPRIRAVGYVMPDVPAQARFLPGDRIVCWGDDTGAVTTPLQFDRFLYVGMTNGHMTAFTQAALLPEPEPAVDQ